MRPDPDKHRREQIEMRRSAGEAVEAKRHVLMANAENVRRYVAPPSDTPYPLEYAFHLLGDVRGRTILEYGCGDGLNTVLLASRGAHVISLDISPELVEVARRRTQVNGLEADVNFIVGSAHDLPLPDESIDVVFGIAILHHLDLELAAEEVWRVLRPGCRAIFQEPMRNSRFVRFVRDLIPYRRPNVSPFEYPLTDEQLTSFADDFSTFRMRPFGSPLSSFVRVVPPLRRWWFHATYRWDAALHRRFPKISYHATVGVAEMVK